MGAAAVPDPAAGGEASRSLAKSVAVGLALAVVVVGTIVVGKTVFFILALAVVVAAQAELYAVLRSAGHAPATLVGLVCGAALMIGAYAQGEVAFGLLLALPLPLCMVWALTVPVAKARSAVASTYFGILYGPFLAAFAVLLLREPDGLILVAAFIGMTAILDAGAYLVGRKVGRHPMAPVISPKKSWEGLAAGSAICIGLSLIVLPFFGSFTPWVAFKLALVVCAVAPLGDLAESLVKRDLGVKDMGSVLPGHGGLFDRIDAILFCAPFAYLTLSVLGWAQL